MPAAFDVSQVVEAADGLRELAESADVALEDTFTAWAERTADVMREEIPVASGETRDSVTVEYGDGLEATIGPTNTDNQGRPVGFFINYGTAAQAPDDFIGRTAADAPGLIPELDLFEVL